MEITVLKLTRRVIGPARLRRRILALAWPTITEQLFQMMLGVVDTIMVGRLGPAALAAVGLGDQIVMLITVAFAAFAVGTTALVARHTGAREPEEAALVAQQSVMVTFALGTGIGVGTYVLAPWSMSVMGAAPEVHPGATFYLRAQAVAMLFLALNLVATGAMRGAGDTRTPLYLSIFLNVIHLGGNYLLIFGNLGFPALGVNGSAVSSATARVITGALAFALLLKPGSSLRLNPREWLRPRWGVIKRVLNIGLPATGEQLMMRLGMTAYVRIVSTLGTVAFAAHRVALNAESLSYMPGWGFAVAATTLVGQGLGAGNSKRAEASGYQAWFLALIIMSMGAAAFFFFSKPLVMIFSDDPEVIRQGAVVLKLVALAQPGLATNMVMAGALRGAGDTRWTMINTTAGIWLVRLPLAYFMALEWGWGLTGAWVAMIADLTFRGALMLNRYRVGRWKTLRV